MAKGTVQTVVQYPSTNVLLILDDETDQLIIRTTREVELIAGYAPWTIGQGDRVNYDDNNICPDCGSPSKLRLRCGRK